MFRVGFVQQVREEEHVISEVVLCCRVSLDRRKFNDCIVLPVANDLLRIHEVLYRSNPDRCHR